MIDLAVTFFVEAFACCFQYTALQANSSLTFFNIDSFFVDDFGLVTSFGRNFVFYVLDRFFYTAVFFLFQICLFSASNDANRGSAP